MGSKKYNIYYRYYENLKISTPLWKYIKKKYYKKCTVIIKMYNYSL